MAVDWLRSAYYGEWRFAKDRPDAITPGRYFFVPDDTPFFDGQTLLGSATWDSYNWRADLGELPGSKRIWDAGRAQAGIPPAQAIGNPVCLRDGEDFQWFIPLRNLRHGYPAACWPTPVESAIADFLRSIERCHVQTFYAAVMDFLYHDLETEIRDLFATVTGGAGVLTFHWNRGTRFPAMVTYRHAGFAVAVIEGTSSLAQITWQAIALLAGPENLGFYSTASAWEIAANFLLTQMSADGFISADDLVTVGHSYGAVCAELAIVKIPFSLGRRACLTFGTPKPGDWRLQKLIARSRCVHLVNDTDIVSLLPPSFPDNAILIPIVSVQTALAYLTWRLPRGTLFQDSDGELRPDVQAISDWPRVVLIVARIVAGLDPAPPTSHLMPEYRMRIARRCPVGPPPALGRLRFVVPPVAAGRVLLANVKQAAASGRLVLKQPILGNCPCCPIETSPDVLFAQVRHVAGEAFADYNNWEIDKTVGAVNCLWQSVGLPPGTSAAYLDLRALSTTPGVLEVTAFILRFGDGFSGFVLDWTPLSSFACSPFGFDEEITLTRTGGQTMTLRITSPPQFAAFGVVKLRSLAPPAGRLTFVNPTVATPAAGRLILPGVAAPAPTLVAHGVMTHGANGGSVTLDTTGATAIAIGVCSYNGLGGLPVITDNKGNTYPAGSYVNNGELTCRLEVLLLPTVGTNHTFTISGTNIYASGFVQAWNLAGVSLLNGPTAFYQGNSGMGGTTIPATAVFSGAMPNVIFSLMGIGAGASGGVSVDDGFTVLDFDEYSSGVNEGGAFAYKINKRVSNMTWTFTNSSLPRRITLTTDAEG